MNAPHIEVSQIWGQSLLRVERFSRTRRLTVGPGHASDFTAALDEPAVLVDGGAIHSDEGAFEITADTDVSIDVGEQTFRIRAVPAERAVGGAFFAHVDWFFMGVVLVSGIVLLLGAIVVVLGILAFQLLRFLLALFFAAAGFATPLFLQMPPPPVPVPPVVASAQIGPIQPVAPAPPVWVKPAPRPVATLTPIPIGDIKPKLRKQPKTRKLESLDKMEYGVLAMLSTREDGEALSGIFGSGEVGGLAMGGYEMGGIEGGVVGGVVGGVPGGVVGGMASDTLGGGGTAVGIGGLGTRGVGGTLGTAEKGWGTLTREQISAAINAHMAAIRGCYERALLADPALQGRVVVSFKVDPSGRVLNARAASSTMNTAVDACVIGEIAAIRFPAPEGGGYATVSYPIAFKIAE